MHGELSNQGFAEVSLAVALQGEGRQVASSHRGIFHGVGLERRAGGSRAGGGRGRRRRGEPVHASDVHAGHGRSEEVFVGPTFASLLHRPAHHAVAGVAPHGGESHVPRRRSRVKAIAVTRVRARREARLDERSAASRKEDGSIRLCARLPPNHQLAVSAGDIVGILEFIKQQFPASQGGCRSDNRAPLVPGVHEVVAPRNTRGHHRDCRRAPGHSQIVQLPRLHILPSTARDWEVHQIDQVSGGNPPGQGVVVCPLIVQVHSLWSEYFRVALHDPHVGVLNVLWVVSARRHSEG
mmetsp:Transcript_15784/g.38333  ORF Transcript_15784/g.38333 Transcript_15784/m.38333 type:complete len:295 (+) Transcript_15784:2372-3256(+)